jgi:integrase
LYCRPNTREWETENRYWKRFFTRFCHFTRRYSDSYRSGIIKVLRSLFNFLSEQKGYSVGLFHRSWTIDTWQAPPVVIMPERLHFLMYNTAFRAGLSHSQQRVLDILILGCTVGLRFSDLMALQTRHLRSNGLQVDLSMATAKTGTGVQIPLPAYAVAIIDRYRGRGQKWLLPRISNNQFNQQLKKIGQLAGWTEPLPKYRSHQGRPMEIKDANGKSWPFYKHLSAHTMRRTAITTLILLGVEEAVVRTISGHAPGSKEFYRYVAFVQSYLDRQVIDAHRRLMENPACYRLPK